MINPIKYIKNNAAKAWNSNSFDRVANYFLWSDVLLGGSLVSYLGFDLAHAIAKNQIVDMNNPTIPIMVAMAGLYAMGYSALRLKDEVKKTLKDRRLAKESKLASITR